jgi:NADPH:quinone reductase-like Zn-dependent oxidoreductase
MAEYAVAPAANLLRLSDSVSYVDAAAMPVAYTTAWRMLVTAGKLKGGDTILTLGVGGGVGSAALVIGRRLGTRVLAGASSQEKRDLAIQHGAEAAVDAGQPFSQQILDLTDGKGVDIVADPLGITWPESIRSLARGGRLVVCGATAGNRPIFDIRELYQRHRSIVGAPMGNWRDFNSVINLLNRGELRPIIDSVYPLADIAAAHVRAESRASFGKVVVTA